jgi:hypothetical protein
MRRPTEVAPNQSPKRTGKRRLAQPLGRTNAQSRWLLRRNKIGAHSQTFATPMCVTALNWVYERGNMCSQVFGGAGRLPSSGSLAIGRELLNFPRSTP